MADRRLDSDIDDSRQSKRRKTENIDPSANHYVKMEKADIDPKTNPYLAHMFEEYSGDKPYQNELGTPLYTKNTTGNASGLSKFPRHATTAALARKAEDGPNNPFSGRPLSQQYFNILESRRNLPVHAQR